MEQKEFLTGGEKERIVSNDICVDIDDINIHKTDIQNSSVDSSSNIEFFISRLSDFEDVWISWSKHQTAVDEVTCVVSEFGTIEIVSPGLNTRRMQHILSQSLDDISEEQAEQMTNKAVKTWQVQTQMECSNVFFDGLAGVRGDGMIFDSFGDIPPTELLAESEQWTHEEQRVVETALECAISIQLQNRVTGSDADAFARVKFSPISSE